MKTAYAHAHTYPHSHPHVEADNGSDLFLTIVWFALMILAARTFYKFVTRYHSKEKSKHGK